MHHNVHSSSIYNSQKLERTQMFSVDEWIQKLWYIYTMEYYSAIRNNGLMKFSRKWMYLENIILSEITLSQKNRHNIQSLIMGY